MGSWRHRSAFQEPGLMMGIRGTGRAEGGRLHVGPQNAKRRASHASWEAQSSSSGSAMAACCGRHFSARMRGQDWIRRTAPSQCGPNQVLMGDGSSRNLCMLTIDEVGRTSSATACSCKLPADIVSPPCLLSPPGSTVMALGMRRAGPPARWYAVQTSPADGQCVSWPDPPRALSGMSSILPFDRFVVTFGGYDECAWPDSALVLDLQAGKWPDVSQRGTWPSPRGVPVLARADQSLAIIGGTGNCGCYSTALGDLAPSFGKGASAQHSKRL